MNKRHRVMKPHPLLAKFASAAPPPAATRQARADTLYAEALRHYQHGQLDCAHQKCRDATQLMPAHADALALSGVLCFVQKDYASAARYLEAAIQAGAGAEAHTNLGLSWNALHRVDLAEAAYREAVKLDPAQSQAWNNLGNLLARSQDPHRRDEALHCYQQALRARPDYASAHTNLGFEWAARRDWVAAERHYREALRLQPRFMPAYNNLSQLLEQRKRPSEALALYQQALKLEPGSAQWLGAALSVKRGLCDWHDADAVTPQALLTALAAESASECTPLNLLALPEATADVQRKTAARFIRSRWAWALAQDPLVTRATRHDGPLRIGYLSADFREHPVVHLLTEVIASHNRERVNVWLYAYGPQVEDAARQALRQATDHFVNFSDVDDLQAARRIRDDGIDVLVDLTGLTTHARLGITALRPAAVIASWLGYIGSLGEARVADYVISDAVATPPPTASDFSEALALMPECYQPNARYQPLAQAPSRVAAGLPEQAMVFCSFNQSFKLNPQLWDDWCEILRAVPDSVLWLAQPPTQHAMENLRHEAHARGVAGHRLVFAPRCTLAEHQARVALADLALDTYPYNSGATASDVLRAGVPIITRAGNTFVSRMAASLLHSCGLSDWVSDSREHYVQRAVALAQNPTRRQALRQLLAQRLPSSPLFQPQRFAQHLEDLFHAMHEQALSGQRAAIRIAPRASAA